MSITPLSASPAALTLVPTGSLSVAAAPSSSSAGIDSLTQQIQPPRFPWLSRVTAQLEQAAAEKKRMFDDAPILGDHLDEKA